MRHVNSKLSFAIIRRSILVYIAFLSGVVFAYGQTHRFSISGGGAVNINNFNWSIAGNLEGKSPNVLSELIFEDITSMGYFLNCSVKIIQNLELTAFYQKNSVMAGKGTDTDFAYDDHTNPTFHQPFSSDRGCIEILSAGAKSIFLRPNKFTLGLGIAYKNYRQNFVILNPELPELQSIYKARWQGPDFSLQGNYLINSSLSVGADISYSLIHYHAEANWNLIEILMQPLSFMQTSNGRGIDLSLNLKYSANDFLSFSLDGTLGNTKTFKGIDTSFLKNGTQISTQLNGTNNTLYGFRLGTIIHF